MPDNKNAIARLVQDEIRYIDLGEYAEIYKGASFAIRVNPPAIIEEFKEAMTRERVVKAICIFAGAEGEDAEGIAKFDDTLLYWILDRCFDLYNAYHEPILKNLRTG